MNTLKMRWCVTMKAIEGERFREYFVGIEKADNFTEKVREPYFTSSVKPKIIWFSLTVDYVIGPGAGSENWIIFVLISVQGHIRKILRWALWRISSQSLLSETYLLPPCINLIFIFGLSYSPILMDKSSIWADFLGVLSRLTNLSHRDPMTSLIRAHSPIL
jgi:hypothetical protein